MSNGLVEAKATYCGRCGTTHVPPSKGGTCPALKEAADDLKVQKIMHKGKHVASIHTFKGRGGGMTSGTHNPDGSPASKKYGIDPFDTKREQIKKIKAYHKGMKEETMKTFAQFMEESVSADFAINESEIKAHHERVKKLKGKQVSFEHPTTKQKITGTMQKIVHMGGLPYAHVETGKSAHRVPVHQVK